MAFENARRRKDQRTERRANSDCRPARVALRGAGLRLRDQTDSNDASSPNLTGVAQLTNLGVFAQYFPQSANVLEQHLSDGGPPPGVALTVYRMAAAVPAARRRSSARAARPTRRRLYVCRLRHSRAATPVRRRITRRRSASSRPKARTSLPCRRRAIAASTDYNVAGGWAGGAPLSRGTIFTDRTMYQPGERGEFTGVAYYAERRSHRRGP